MKSKACVHLTTQTKYLCALVLRRSRQKIQHLRSLLRSDIVANLLPELVLVDHLHREDGEGYSRAPPQTIVSENDSFESIASHWQKHVPDLVPQRIMLVVEPEQEFGGSHASHLNLRFDAPLFANRHSTADMTNGLRAC